LLSGDGRGSFSVAQVARRYAYERNMIFKWFMILDIAPDPEAMGFGG